MSRTAVFLAAALVAACGESSTTPSDASPGVDGGGGSGEAGGGGDGSASMDTAAGDAAPAACVDVRACVNDCVDQACTRSCLDRGTPQARDLYEMLLACSARVCPTGDMNCRCENECWYPSECVELRDMCVDNGPDSFCDLCH